MGVCPAQSQLRVADEHGQDAANLPLAPPVVAAPTAAATGLRGGEPPARSPTPPPASLAKGPPQQVGGRELRQPTIRGLRQLLGAQEAQHTGPEGAVERGAMSHAFLV